MIMMDTSSSSSLSIQPDVKTYTTVIKAWSKSNATDAPEQCQRLLDEMTKATTTTTLEPNMVAYSAVMDAYARRGRAKEAEQVLRQMMMNGDEIEPSTRSFNIVLNAWSKSSLNKNNNNVTDDIALQQCKRLLEEMKQRASIVDDANQNAVVAPNTVTYDTIIHAYASRGRAREAEELLREMMKMASTTARGIVKPDVRSFNVVLNAWSKSDADEAEERFQQLLADMREFFSSSSTTAAAASTGSHTSKKRRRFSTTAVDSTRSGR